MVAVIKALEELPQAEDSEPLRSDATYLTLRCHVGTRFWGICPRVFGLSREFWEDSKDGQWLFSTTSEDRDGIPRAW